MTNKLKQTLLHTASMAPPTVPHQWTSMYRPELKTEHSLLLFFPSVSRTHTVTPEPPLSEYAPALMWVTDRLDLRFSTSIPGLPPC